MLKTRIWMTLVAILSVAVAYPQQARTSAEGHRLEWTGDLDPTPDTLVTRGARLPAWTITVQETNARGAMRLWNADIRPKASRVGGSRPVLARDARLPGAEDMVLDVRASVEQDRRSGHARITMAFGRGDSALGHDLDALRQAARGMAVRLNRAVVQQQIDAVTKQREKSHGKAEDHRKDQQKLEQRLAKANRDLERIKVRKSRVQRSSARLRGDVTGLEHRFALSNNPRDLKRLTRARNQLAREESRMARMMRDEARAQGQVNKHQRDLDAARKGIDVHSGERDDRDSTLDALRRKLDSIR